MTFLRTNGKKKETIATFSRDLHSLQDIWNRRLNILIMGGTMHAKYYSYFSVYKFVAIVNYCRIAMQWAGCDRAKVTLRHSLLSHKLDCLLSHSNHRWIKSPGQWKFHESLQICLPEFDEGILLTKPFSHRWFLFSFFCFRTNKLYFALSGYKFPFRRCC